MKLANYERYCIQFQKYDHIFDGQCRVKIKRLHLKGLGEGGLFSKLSDHLFVTYTRTYIKCPVVSLQFRRLMRATLRFKLATVTLSGRPCLIKSWSGRCGKGVGKNVKSIAPPLPNPLTPPLGGGMSQQYGACKLKTKLRKTPLSTTQFVRTQEKKPTYIPAIQLILRFALLKNDLILSTELIP